MQTIPINHDYINTVMDNASKAAELFAAYDRQTTDRIVKNGI